MIISDLKCEVLSWRFLTEGEIMKRLISASAADFKRMPSDEFKQSIIASEGRVIVGETVVTATPLLEGVTNAEVMASFGSDLILLNEFDVFEQKISGLDVTDDPIKKIKHLTGRPIGINLEPVDQSVEGMGNKITISKGRQANKETFKKANELGVDFLLLTGNPSTGVTNKMIKESISVGKQFYKGLIFAGKMHGAGVSEEIINPDELREYINEGADGILIPAAGTVPGVSEEQARKAVKAVKTLNNQAIVISSIGTSQESADGETIRHIGLSNKRIGADVHHIGDGGYGRMPIPENIMKLGITVRGKRHTYFRMAQSINR